MKRERRDGKLNKLKRSLWIILMNCINMQMKKKIFIARLFLLQTGKGKVCTPKVISQDKKVLNLKLEMPSTSCSMIENCMWFQFELSQFCLKTSGFMSFLYKQRIQDINLSPQGGRCQIDKVLQVKNRKSIEQGLADLFCK